MSLFGTLCKCRLAITTLIKFFVSIGNSANYLTYLLVILALSRDSTLNVHVTLHLLLLCLHLCLFLSLKPPVLSRVSFLQIEHLLLFVYGSVHLLLLLLLLFQAFVGFRNVVFPKVQEKAFFFAATV